MLKDEKKIIKCPRKKLDSVIKEKNKENKIHENLNPVVTNLSSHDLSNEELSILKFRLKHGLATRPNKSNILSYTEDIWEQIEKANICRNEMCSKAKIKNSLRGFAFNLINIDDTRLLRDCKLKSNNNSVKMLLFSNQIKVMVLYYLILKIILIL